VRGDQITFGCGSGRLRIFLQQLEPVHAGICKSVITKMEVAGVQLGQAVDPSTASSTSSWACSRIPESCSGRRRRPRPPVRAASHQLRAAVAAGRAAQHQVDLALRPPPARLLRRSWAVVRSTMARTMVSPGPSRAPWWSRPARGCAPAARAARPARVEHAQHHPLVVAALHRELDPPARRAGVDRVCTRFMRSVHLARVAADLDRVAPARRGSAASASPGPRAG